MEFIDAQFEAYLQEELKIKRTLHSYHDTRIHACLYFIAPTGHSLKSLDLVTMKKLDSKVSDAFYLKKMFDQDNDIWLAVELYSSVQYFNQKYTTSWLLFIFNSSYRPFSECGSLTQLISSHIYIFSEPII